MRVIGGKFKNKKLHFSENITTRPLKDSVRENIFNILTHSNNVGIEIKKSNVLDLYAGTGSFGLECISREASRVFFVENDLDALKKLKKNIKNLNSESKTTLLSQDVLSFFKNLTLELYKEKFNIIFLDPPYKDKKCVEIIDMIKKKEILNKKHAIVIHREVNSNDRIDKHINIIENRVYGRSEIFFGRLF
jgi:16S rRNA (guanine966-N2)-methyltransferase